MPPSPPYLIYEPINATCTPVMGLVTARDIHASTIIVMPPILPMIVHSRISTLPSANIFPSKLHRTFVSMRIRSSGEEGEGEGKKIEDIFQYPISFLYYVGQKCIKRVMYLQVIEHNFENHHFIIVSKRILIWDRKISIDDHSCCTKIFDE